MDSAVFASVAETFTFFAVKIRLTCGETNPLSAKCAKDSAKETRGILNSEPCCAQGRNLRQPRPDPGQPNNLAKQLNN